MNGLLSIMPLQAQGGATTPTSGAVDDAAPPTAPGAHPALTRQPQLRHYYPWFTLYGTGSFGSGLPANIGSTGIYGGGVCARLRYLRNQDTDSGAMAGRVFGACASTSINPLGDLTLGGQVDFGFFAIDGRIPVRAALQYNYTPFTNQHQTLLAIGGEFLFLDPTKSSVNASAGINLQLGSSFNENIAAFVVGIQFIVATHWMP